MDDIDLLIRERKAAFDALRPLATDAVASLRSFFDVELTYSSNAIEGNTLTLRETAEVIEHGITVGGKPLRDHLEAQDHYAALGWMRELAASGTPLGEGTASELHRRIVLRSAPEIGGVYSTLPRRIAGSAVVFPNAAKLPFLMAGFGDWLSKAEPSYAAAFEAHYRLVSIHPFSDGNGRAARLLMNLLLIKAGHPPIAIRPEDRAGYLRMLEHAQLQGDRQPFDELLGRRLVATYDAYLELVRAG